MLNYPNLFIALLLFFCCYATYTDLRERKIKNFCSYGLIYAGILSQVISVLSGSSSLLSSIFTVVGGFLIVLALYWFGIFAAGDAKLVWGASLLMPVGLFSEAAAFAQYTPTTLVINIFVPYCVILVYVPLPQNGCPTEMAGVSVNLPTSVNCLTRTGVSKNRYIPQ